MILQNKQKNIQTNYGKIFLQMSCMVGVPMKTGGQRSEVKKCFINGLKSNFTLQFQILILTLLKKKTIKIGENFLSPFTKSFYTHLVVRLETKRKFYKDGNPESSNVQAKMSTSMWLDDSVRIAQVSPSVVQSYITKTIQEFYKIANQ